MTATGVRHDGRVRLRMRTIWFFALQCDGDLRHRACPFELQLLCLKTRFNFQTALCGVLLCNWSSTPQFSTATLCNKKLNREPGFQISTKCIGWNGGIARTRPPARTAPGPRGRRRRERARRAQRDQRERMEQLVSHSGLPGLERAARRERLLQRVRPESAQPDPDRGPDTPQEDPDARMHAAQGTRDQRTRGASGARLCSQRFTAARCTFSLSCTTINGPCTCRSSTRRNSVACGALMLFA